MVQLTFIQDYWKSHGLRWQNDVCACCIRSHFICDPMDCSPPGSPVHGILQVRILEWAAMLSPRVSSPPRDQTCMSCVSVGGRFFTASATWEALFLKTELSQKAKNKFCILMLICLIQKNDTNELICKISISISNWPHSLVSQRVLPRLDTTVDFEWVGGEIFFYKF